MAQGSRPAGILSIAALAVVVAAAQPRPEFGGPVVSSVERFNLYTGCAPVEVVAELSERDAARPARLTRDAIGAVAYERLEAAGLLETGAAHKLNLGVGVMGGTLTMWVRFLKPLHDPLAAQTRHAATWIRFTSGAHLGQTQAILDTLGQHVDTFITAYRRINQEACDQA